eukprot:CAMPEP_0198137446 /NCGR_PEP_ID=MMETSP1443-20131203/924_1 /TAXON_ID=186043 /ORGANISM="Entomoneis sp., Strain CCMP2396" /LENGTH=30 /DNA_ID= /DNA_START= /DNA_END= /DNA_ORIENTATION=
MTVDIRHDYEFGQRKDEKHKACQNILIRNG